jgi:hypothetical protein
VEGQIHFEYIKDASEGTILDIISSKVSEENERKALPTTSVLFKHYI